MRAATVRGAGPYGPLANDSFLPFRYAYRGATVTERLLTSFPVIFRATTAYPSVNAC